MNAHIPQSYEAAVELGEIAAVQHQIITPRDSKPVIGVVQDTLVGSYRLTRPGNLFNKREIFNLMMWNKRFDGQLPEAAEQGKWSGAQVMSTMLPPLNMSMKNKLYNEKDDADKDYQNRVNVVKIREGEVQQGTFDKEIFSKAGKGIIHVTYNDYGSQETVNLLDTLQNTIEQFLIYNGFSVGISDLVADDSTRQRMEEEINIRKKKIEEITLQVHQDIFNNNTGKTNRAEFEDRVFTAINEATSVAGKLGLQSLADENRMTAMIRAGSKGSEYNVAQMIACVGQQAIDGKRVPYGFTDRTLPHFKKYDDGAEARGFIESSFVRGLTPSEFFFHAMSGREGLIDTAVKTADTGYIQRQLVKSMEDLITHFDGTVRDAKGNIVQFHYGEDGISATKIEGQGLGLSKMSEEDIRNTFSMKDTDFSTILSEGVERESDTELLTTYVEQMLADRKMLVETMFGSGAEQAIMAPVNLERILLNMKTRFNLKSNATTDLTPAYVLEGMTRLIQRTQPYNRLWQALVRFHLAPHNLIVRDRFTKKAFDTLIEIVITRNWKAWAIPGEQVGIVAAQSIGEPATQMSMIGTCRILINSENSRQTGAIGDFVDNLLKENAAQVVSLGNDSVVLDLDEDYYVLSVAKDEKTAWKRISQVSRHPANGGLVKVTTRSGRQTTATLSHSFLKRAPTGVVAVKGSDLRVGDRVPIAREAHEVPNPLKELDGFQLTKDFGWLCGMYLADGYFNGNTVGISKIAPIVEERIRKIAETYPEWKISIRHHQGEYGPGKDNFINSWKLKDFLLKHFGTGSYEKHVGGDIYHANVEFIRGVVAGYFDGDGNVNVERQQIRASSRNKQLIRDMNLLLSFCGIFGVIGEEASSRIPGKSQHTLNILKKYAQTYKDRVGFSLPEKIDGLEQIIAYMEREDKHCTSEQYDKIPELGEIIAETGRLLRMPGCSRTYGRWVKKESVGRLTLQTYIQNFKDMMEVHVDSSVVDLVNENLAILEQAVSSDVVWDEIIDLEYLSDPKEYVYDFTVPGNESFMVDDAILVHNTLNSVDWDTEIMIMRDGKVVTPQIGEFIDNYYRDCDKEKVQHMANGQIYIPLEDGHDWKAVSCDENGKMMWTRLEAITRHPVVNEDGTNTILKVTTEAGRVVKATKGHSFLTLVDGKVRDVNGSELRVGDVLPIAQSLATGDIPIVSEVSLRQILPATEYLYGSDAQTALSYMKGGDRRWFQKHQGVEFTVPYGRSDAFRDAFENGRNSNAANICAGYVYPKRTRENVSQIPESIPLTNDFGFFVGAYVAEGCSNETQVSITNNDEKYLEKVRSLMDSWNVGTHLVKAEKSAKKSGISGTSTSLIIHSTILARVMTALFGRVSSEKTLPAWTLQAPMEFVEGLVDAYISGDGTVTKYGQISATSISKNLLESFIPLFARVGIFTTLASREHTEKASEKFDNVHEYYTLTIPKKWGRIFYNTFTLTNERKQMTLESIHKNGKYARESWQETQDMVWDKIKTIEEVTPMGEGWVYDLTVETTRNFMTKMCLGQRDTFHLAGVAAKSNVTRGVPRLKELLKVTKSPKATTLTVYLKPEYRESKEKAREVSQDLELTLLRDITIKAAVYYDPKLDETVLEEDKELLAFYNLFEQRMKEAEGTEEEENWSKWMLRLEFDREKMFNKNISMDDIAFVMNTHFGGEVNMVYSDYNSQKLVMRIRLVPTPAAKGESTLDDLRLLKSFQNKILNGIVIRGLSGIKAAPFRFLSQEMEQTRIEKDGKYDVLQEYIIDTDGSNFLEVANHPAVDSTRIISNHVHDILPYLGVEAARATLISEMTTLFSEVGINYRHLGLLTDVMTRAGRLMSVDRYGINKMDIGPLAKASFEETGNILLRAAIFGEMDPVTGVSANIMTGQAIRGGTAFSQILLDEQAFMKLQETADVLERDEEEVIELDDDLIYDEIHQDPNDRCSTTRLKMNMVLPNAEMEIEDEEVEIRLLD